MNKKVKMLDCTLRDGGYINDWDFGHSVITGTYKRLDAAGVDYIEVGFLDDRREFDINRSIMPNTEAINKIFKGVEKKHAVPVAMIDYGTCSIDSIGSADTTFIDGIRVIFKKEKIEQALPFCKQIKEKGYKLFIQAISITAYSDIEMIEYVQKINEIKPYAFSIVDTYGLLDNKSLGRYFYLIDHNLDPEIRMGYHEHNNFQLGFSNTIKYLSFETERELVADSTVYGMGKSAGNCASELLAMHLNEYYKKNYNLSLLLEIVDTDLMSIYQKHYWGYKYDFYIAAMQRCHPTYVKYLLDKKTLSVTSINEILSRIPDDIKLSYNKDWIEQAYIDYQAKKIDDAESFEKLKSLGLNERSILILGPGETVRTEKPNVLDFIRANQPVVFAVNFYSKDYPIDFVFMSNAKRYSKLADVLQNEKIGTSLILTSNITALDDYQPEMVFNFESLLNKQCENLDNSLVLFLSVINKLRVEKVNLAGFDGFGNPNGDYYQRSYEFHRDKNESYNDSMSRDLSLINEEFVRLNFITSTRYRLLEGIKAVLFDLDGTLLDTSEGIRESVKHTIHALGYDELSDDTILKFVGPPIQNSLKTYLGLNEAEAQTGANIFRDYYKNHALFKASLYPGIMNLLSALRENHIRIGVATYKREDYAIDILRHFGIADFCTTMHGADNENKLSKADIIKLCAKELGCVKDAIVYVGDTDNDEIGASNAGLRFMPVTWGFGFKNTAENKHKYTYIINKPDEMKKFVKLSIPDLVGGGKSTLIVGLRSERRAA